MRVFGCVVMLGAMILVGCATPPPPKIEGRVNSISPKDIEDITALVHHDMKKDFWHVVPIDRIEVRDHNNVVVYYQNENYNHTVPIERFHGVWTLPRVTIM